MAAVESQAFPRWEPAPQRKFFLLDNDCYNTIEDIDAFYEWCADLSLGSKLEEVRCKGKRFSVEYKRPGRLTWNIPEIPNHVEMDDIITEEYIKLGIETCNKLAPTKPFPWWGFLLIILGVLAAIGIGTVAWLKNRRSRALGGQPSTYQSPSQLSAYSRAGSRLPARSGAVNASSARSRSSSASRH